MGNPSTAHPGQRAETSPPRIILEPAGGRARAVFHGETVAVSDRAIILREAGYPPRTYFPVRDVRMDLLRPTTRSTHCPHKGDASYWTVAVGAHQADNAAWAYLRPLPGVAEIKDHLSFADAVRIET